MKLDVSKISTFLELPAVKTLDTLFTQQLIFVPETVIHTCFQTMLGIAPSVTTVACSVDPLRMEQNKLLELLWMPTITFSLLGPSPKSKILFQFLTTEDEMKNHEQMDMLFGSLKDGKVKKRAVASVLNNALDEDAPNAPDAWDVGGFAEAVRGPVMPVTSSSNWLGLKV